MAPLRRQSTIVYSSQIPANQTPASLQSGPADPTQASPSTGTVENAPTAPASSLPKYSILPRSAAYNQRNRSAFEKQFLVKRTLSVEESARHHILKQFAPDWDVLPSEYVLLKREDLVDEPLPNLKRFAKMVMVPAHKTRKEILDAIFSHRNTVPYCPRKHRSLRTAAVERGLIKRHGIQPERPCIEAKMIRGHNPHKKAIWRKSTERPPGQPLTPTESVASTRQATPEPEEEQSAPLPALDKGKDVDRGDMNTEEIESPFPRPTRVPLGQISEAEFGERFGGQPPEPSEHDDQAEDDPSRGKDSGTVYTYPPPGGEGSHWLPFMRWGIKDDARRLNEELERVREVIDKALVEITLAESEVDEEWKMYDKLLTHIGRVAGPEFVQFLRERAEAIELPEYEEDDYAEQEYEHDEMLVEQEQNLAGAEANAADRQLMADTSRPSDTLSYLDPSSPPPTSPLAGASSRAKRRREAILDEPPTSPTAPKRRRLASPDAPSRPVSPHEEDGERPATGDDAPSRSRSRSRSPASRFRSPSVSGSPSLPAGSGRSQSAPPKLERTPPPPPPPRRGCGCRRCEARSRTPSEYSDLVSPLFMPSRAWLKRNGWIVEDPEPSELELDAQEAETEQQDGEEGIQEDAEAGPGGTLHVVADEEASDPAAEMEENQAGEEHVDIPDAEEPADDSGVDVTGEYGDEGMDEDNEEDQLQGDQEDAEGGEQQAGEDDPMEAEDEEPAPRPVTPPPTRRQTRSRNPFNPTPRSRDIDGNKIRRTPRGRVYPGTANGTYRSPPIG
ncbi:hypothetical protein BV20DRAFT_970012 [Pilatotrama ljubarskyi]|nr:hypothetical protein BV20DRAFT_970012 [Pilatotrama ljubarskyi]